jgi:DNA-binding Xre family transcriptional regulator
MLTNNLQHILQLQNITHPNKWLCKKLQCSIRKASDLLHNKVESMQMQNILSLCTELNCTPNDLFSISEKDAAALPDHHALHALRITTQKPIAINKLLPLLSPMQLKNVTEQISTLIHQQINTPNNNTTS